MEVGRSVFWADSPVSKFDTPNKNPSSCTASKHLPLILNSTLYHIIGIHHIPFYMYSMFKGKAPGYKKGEKFTKETNHVLKPTSNQAEQGGTTNDDIVSYTLCIILMLQYEPAKIFQSG